VPLYIGEFGTYVAAENAARVWSGTAASGCQGKPTALDAVAQCLLDACSHAGAAHVQMQIGTEVAHARYIDLDATRWSDRRHRFVS
jgi:hypothetical protein